MTKEAIRARRKAISTVTMTFGSFGMLCLGLYHGNALFLLMGFGYSILAGFYVNEWLELPE